MTAVSVVIPTVGRSELLRAIESVREQSYACVETIVVLDRPSVEADVRGVLQAGERLVITDGGLGGGAARSIGLSESQGSFVAFLDDDDWWEPRKVEMQVDAMVATDATFSSTASYFESEKGVRILPEAPLGPSESVASYLVRRPRLRHGAGYIQTSSIMVSSGLAKSVSWKAGLKKHQDWDFVVRCSSDPGFKYQYVEEALVHVTQGTVGSVSKRADWAASSRWYADHRGSLDKVAAGDFVLTQVVRGALSEFDARGVTHGMSLLRGTRPHLAAAVVGVFGVVEGLKRVVVQRRE